MASSHSRNASGAEHRGSNLGGGARSRVTSTRAREHEKPTVRDDGSPVISENYFSSKSGERLSKKVNRDISGTERTTERTHIFTREKITKTRSPVKESASAGNRGDVERSKMDTESPISRPKSKQKETEQVTWNPSATLKPHSSALLAVRVSAPPLSLHSPASLRPKSLQEMDMQEQEAALLDDLLYVFMGYEGQYVTFVDSYKPSEEKDRLAGPEFRVLPGLDLSLRDLARPMLKMAAHHCAVEAFVEVQSREEFGSVNHALCAAVRKLLKDYLILIAQLEVKVINDPSFTMHQMHLHIIPTAQSLAHLYALTQELLKKNSLLEEEMDETIGDFDAENILERLREGGDLLPGSMTRKRCIGGNVLALLTHRLATFFGDPAARALLEMLLREASRPYVAMLNEWLYHGGIRDPHSEFLIGERAGIKRERMDEDYTDEYWEKRYYIRDREVPPQIEAVKEKVLLAGKYLNVVRECGGVNISNDTKDRPRTLDDPRFLDNVTSAYSHANASLLSLLLTKNSLRSRLRSMKHYFFLDRAEFFLYFLELSTSELRKSHRSVNIGKLQSLLDLVLRQPGSIAAADPFKEDVKVKMNETGLTQWLMKIVMVQGIDQDNPDSLMERYQTPGTSNAKDDEKEINGFEALELDYTVPFPLSLVISRKTVLRYQLLFRYTLALRHLEIMLVDCWSEHSKVRSWVHKSSQQKIEIWKRRAWTLRARMLVFVQQMLFFATAEVIEPNWQKLMAKVDEAQLPDADVDAHPDVAGRPRSKARRTVDELMQDHLDMLDSCMKDLGLTQSKLLRIHAKLMSGCTMFATYTANFSRSLYSADPDLTDASPDTAAGTTNANLPGRNPPANMRNASSATATATSTSTSIVIDADPPANRLAKMEETLKRFEEHFSRHLKILIDSLNYYAATETVVLLSLCARLTAAEPSNRDRDVLI